MANLPVTVTISTPLPMSSRDLPKLTRIAAAAAKAAGAAGDLYTSQVVDGRHVITFTVNAR